MNEHRQRPESMRRPVSGWRSGTSFIDYGVSFPRTRRAAS